jgi:uncharacterized protein YdhG (YjbR/CyaY superfamily)
MNTEKFKTVDEYLASFPAGTKKILLSIRNKIKETAPQAQEVISYNMPAYKLNGVLLYFAGYRKHIGFYPTASGITAFEKELGAYKYSKGAIQFPIDKPLPFDLISRIIKHRVKENKSKPKK